MNELQNKGSIYVCGRGGVGAGVEGGMFTTVTKTSLEILARVL